MNESERRAFQVCRRSFLNLWSYANPRRNDGKELCDVLVVCAPDVILFSVKESEFKETGRPDIDRHRWTRKAIEESVRQLDTAERELRLMSHVVRKDGTKGLPLPTSGAMRVHKVAIALGSARKAPVASGNHGRGFVHAFDDDSWRAVLEELDTITDFVEYLEAREDLHNLARRIEADGEEDLLALYLHNGRWFPVGLDDVIQVPSGSWELLTAKPEWRARKEADRASRAWDNLIELFCRHLSYNPLEGNPLGMPTDPWQRELVVRTMARENRLARRILGHSFAEWLRQNNRLRSRMVPTQNGVTYVFLSAPHGLERRYRFAELGNRCFVARMLNPESLTVVGIATEEHDPSGFSLDGLFLYKPVWTPQDQLLAESLQKEFKLFSAPQIQRGRVDEFPGT